MNTKRTLTQTQSPFLKLAMLLVTLVVLHATSASAFWFVSGISSVGAQSGTLTYGTVGSATFAVTVTGSGSGGQTDAYSASGLPTGATWAFNPASADSSHLTSTLTVTTAANTPAGSFTITVTCNGHNGTATLTVNQKTLTPTVTLNNKVYDGTTAATTIATRSLSGIVGSDNVTLGTSGTVAAFSSRNVGGYTPSVTGLSLSGSAAGNYVLSTTSVSPSASITARPLTVTAQANSKTYDGGTSAATAPGITSGAVQTGDTANFSETYNTKTVGTSKTLTPSGTVNDGNSGNNYSYTFQTASTGTITRKGLTVTGITASNKAYDGNTTATLDTTGATLVGAVTGDAVTLDTTGATGAFTDSDVGIDKTVLVSGLTLTGADTGNYTLAQPTTTATITGAELTVAGIEAQNKVYDATTDATLIVSNATLVGVVSGDTVTLDTTNAVGTFADKNVGTGKTVQVSGLTLSGADAAEYTLTQPTTNADITALGLTVTGAAVTPKVYDGTTDAAITGATLNGVVDSEDVSLANASTGTFADKNIGLGKAVTSAMTLAGADIGNYTLTQPTLSGDITALGLTVTGAAVTPKVYDGNADAAITGATLNGAVSGDAVTLANATTGTFDNKNIGNDKPVTSGMTLAGADAGNYTLTQPTLTGDITAKGLTVTGAAVTPKVYDGTTTAAITGAMLNGVVGTEDVTLANATTGLFNNSNIGLGKPVDSAMTLAGTDAGNYTLTQPTLSGDITPKGLAVTGAVVTPKVYDGTAGAAITGAMLNGVVGSEDVTLANAGTGTFNNKNIGTGKPVTSAMTLAGADIGNYTLTQPALTGNITAKGLTVTGITASNKAYDGTTTATLDTTGATLVGAVTGDAVTLDTTGAAGAFTDAEVGTDKTVLVSGLTLTGADAGNYTLAQPTTTATITQAGLTVAGIEAQNKVYDATTDATLIVSNATLVGVISGDTVTLDTTNAVGAFADKNVGTGKLVTVSGLTLLGADAAKYTLTQPTTNADITALGLTVTGAAVTPKVYDGTTDAAITGATLNGVVNSEDVSLANASTGTFADKNIGLGKAVTSAMTLAGADIGNYTLTQPTLSGDITALGLTVTGAAVTPKVYDGNADAAVTGATLNGAVSGDAVTLANATAGTFADKNIGNDKPVTSAMTLAGTDAGNYTLTQPTLTGDITAKGLTVTGAAVTPKVYDGTTTAAITGAMLNGVVSGDVVTLANATTGLFNNSNIGLGKPVDSAMTLAGTDAGNYTLTQPTLSGDITPKGLAVTGAVVTPKVYDGTTGAAITGAMLNGVVGSEDVTLANADTGTFNNKNIGTGKAVTSAMTLAGVDIGNYTLTQPALTGNITAKGLTVTGAAVTPKVYDGTADAAITGATLNGVVGSEDVTLANASSGTFADKNIGLGKAVNSAMTLAGADIGNYTLTQPTLTGNITAKGLTVTGITVNNKAYDGTTTATLNTAGATLVGPVTGDAVTLDTAAAVGSFTDPDPGTNKTVLVTGLTLAGADAGNYTLTQPTLTGDVGGTITVGGLTVTGIEAENKVYDATTAATLIVSNATLVGVISGDTVTLDTTNAVGAFADKNVGTGKTVQVSGLTLSGADAAKYTLTQPTTNADITALGLTVTGAAVTPKVYDGTTDAAITGATLNGVVDSEDVTLANANTGTFADKNIGLGKAVTSAMTLAGADIGNYTLTQPTLNGDITAKGLTVTGAAVTPKVYDGTTDAAITGATLNGAVSGDAVTLANATAGTFADKIIGLGKAVTSAMTLAGADAGNYTLPQPSLTGDITAKGLTVIGAAVTPKMYDGNTMATITGATLNGVVSGDDVTLANASTGTFNNQNIGLGKPVDSAMTLAGADAGNYTLPQPTLTGDITAKVLTVIGAAVTPKVYDGTTTATITGATLSGVVASEVVTIVNDSAGTFADKNIGLGKTVTSAMTLGGADAGNYTLTPPTLTGDITAKGLTVTGAAVTPKVYDGTAGAAITGATLNGVVNSEAVTLANASTGTFADKNIGLGKAVTSAMTLTGADIGNYTLTQPTLTGNITAKGLTVTGITASNKAYDGTTTATLNTTGATLVGPVTGDAVTLDAAGATGAFTDAEVGTDKTVLVSGLTLTGADAGNYTLAQPTTTATITVAGLTVAGIEAQNKAYDGTPAATLNVDSAVLVGVISGDTVTLDTTNAAGAFADKNVGTGKLVTVSGLALLGADAAKYTLTQPTTNADITALGLTVTGAGVTPKVYDGTTDAAITGATLNGVVDSEDVTLANATAGTFADKNIGLGKAVTSAMTLAGADIGNYTLTQPTLTGDITAKGLTVTGAAVTPKVYDGNTTATITGATLNGVVDSEDVTLANATAGTFNDDNIGLGKPVDNVMTLAGADAGNYTLTPPTLTGDITAKVLTVIGAAVTPKVYDGTTTATITGATLSGVVDSEVVTIVNDSAGTFADKNIGLGKTVTSAMTLGGADAGNYTLTQPTLTGDITARGLTVTGAAVTPKVYDGTTDAAITGATLIGVVNSEAVTLANASSGTFADKNIGLGKAVTSAMTLAGADAGNYTLTQPALTGDITAKGLTVTGITASNKSYDGNTIATLNTAGATLVGPVTGDLVTLDTSAAAGAFTDAKVGTGKAVLVSGLTLTGTDVGNYTLAQPTLTADITQASSLTALLSSQNPSGLGSDVTFTATVTPVAPASTTPTGTVQFYTNGVTIGTPVALTNGVATLTTADLPAGTNTVMAAYLGDDNFLSSNESLKQVVSAIETPTTVSIQNNGDGTVTVNFTGTPNAQYVVQATDNLAAPAWVNISTNNADAGGQWTFSEAIDSHPVRFYRSAIPLP